MMTTTDYRNRLRRWLREPLVQFLAIGILLCLIYAWRGEGPGSNQIFVTPGRIDSLAAGFASVWNRQPTQPELKGLIDDFVREEIATREAARMGLDRNDVVIRRRLRQKVEFLAEDTFDVSPPTNAELQAWLDQHPDRFRIEPQVAFRQVFLNPALRHDAIRSNAKMLLTKLSSTGSTGDIEGVGDSLMLPNEMSLTGSSEIARLFGSSFADVVMKLQLGQWVGPVESAYGLHLVFVQERVEGRLPSLDQIRSQVEREVLATRRKSELNAMYDRLLAGYHVTIQSRTSSDVAQASSKPRARANATLKDVD
jgi:hypothetical protein